MRRVLRVVPYIILIFAFYVLKRELSHLRWDEFQLTLRQYQWPTFFFASLLLLINYFIWSGYDWISLRQQKIRLPFSKIFRTTAIAYPITNLVGYSLLTGFAVRLRRYEPLGVTYAQITKLIIFNISSWWIGFLTLCGAAIVYSPDGELFKISNAGARWIGIGLLGVVGAYLTSAWYTKGRELHFFGRWHMHMPSLRSGLIKIFVSVCDNLVVGLTLFVFLPSVHDISFARFMAYFLSATLVALLSFVPAGWGVLEGVLLYLFRPYAPDAEILASLVLFRVFHYLIPVGLALVYWLATLVSNYTSGRPVKSEAPGSLRLETKPEPAR